MYLEIIKTPIIPAKSWWARLCSQGFFFMHLLYKVELYVDKDYFFLTGFKKTVRHSELTGSA